MVSQFKSVSNKDLKSQSDWALEFAVQLLKFVNTGDGTIIPEQKVSALLLLMMNSDKINKCLSYIGDRDSISVDEVHDLLKDRGGTNRGLGDVAILAKKKKPTSSKLKCYFCGENHAIQNCPKFKAANPTANLFEGSGDKVGKDSTSDQFSFYANLLSAGEEVSKGWIFNSRSSIHVCNDKTEFVTLEPCHDEEVTGVAGKESLQGIGKVVLNNMILNRVAYVPDIPFNLISISAATEHSHAQFLFAKDSLMIRDSNDADHVIAKKTRGLYLMTSHHEAPTSLIANEDTDALLPHKKPTLPEGVVIHGRLGHPGVSVFSNLAKRMDLPTINRDNLIFMSSMFFC